MFASISDARASATPKTILLDIIGFQSVIELERQPVSWSAEDAQHRNRCRMWTPAGSLIFRDRLVAALVQQDCVIA